MTFSRGCTCVVHWLGSPRAFVVSLAVYPLWLWLGGAVIDVVTLLSFSLIFVLLNTARRDTAAEHLKLDEIIRGMPQLRNEVAGSESLEEPEIERLKERP